MKQNKTQSLTDKQRYVSVQILRILACLGVFSVHFGQRVDLSGGLRILTDFGQYGVQFFFIISGFLAAKGFASRKISTVEYYKKRAIHILPLYYFSILWFFVTENILNQYLHQIPKDEMGLYWIRYIFPFINGFVGSETYFWSNLGITWTIPIFLTFYLIAPFTVGKIKSFKSACFVSAIVYLITNAINCFYPCTVFNNIWVFFVGVLGYYAIKSAHGLQITLTFQMIAIFMVIINRKLDAYIALFFCVLVTFVLLENKIKLPLRVRTIINYVDKRTYTLYLVHGLVFCSFIDRAGSLNIGNLGKGILSILLSSIGTIIIYKFFEKPIQNFLTCICIRNNKS